MFLYKIEFIHFAQKDSERGIVNYAYANNAEDVYDYIDKTFMHGVWSDRNIGDGMLNIYDSKYNVIGQETYKGFMLRVGGEIHSDDVDTSDSYYGVTAYGWTFEGECCDEQFNVLNDLDILVDLT